MYYPSMLMRNASDQPSVVEETDTQTALDRPWHVIVLNDPVNLMSYVVMVFQRVFGFDRQTAEKHMMEVHEQGRSRVWTGEREQAEMYVYQLHEWQLNAVLEKDE